MIVDFPTVLLMSVVSTAAVLALYFKIGIRRVMGFNAIADVGGSFLMAAFFGMSTMGIFTAAMGGLWLSIALSILRKIMGYETFNFRTGHWEYHGPTRSVRIRLFGVRVW